MQTHDISISNTEPLDNNHVTVALQSHNSDVIVMDSNKSKAITNTPPLPDSSVTVTLLKAQQNTRQTPNSTIRGTHDFSSVPFYLQVTGIKRRFLLYVFQNCQRIGSKTSSPIRISEAAKACSCTVKTLETIINRLRKEGYLKRDFHEMEGKDGLNTFCQKLSIKPFLGSSPRFR